MNLQLRGRPAQPMHVELVRAINDADLALLASGAERPSEGVTLKKMRDSHHALAAVLAKGTDDHEASLITGYAVGTIRFLKAEATFRELLEHYRANEKSAKANVVDRLSSLSLDCIEEIRDRLNDDPTAIKVRELLDIAVMGLDRTGHGPTSKQISANLTLTAEDIARLAQGRDYAEGVEVVEVMQVHRGAASSRLIEQPLERNAEAAGQQGEGKDVREERGEASEVVGTIGATSGEPAQ